MFPLRKGVGELKQEMDLRALNTAPWSSPRLPLHSRLPRVERRRGTLWVENERAIPFTPKV